MDKVTVVFVLGAPGSGKGTQCRKIVEKYGWTHLSTGDLLRNEVQEGTELGQQVEETLATGQMVPTDLILDLLTNAMASSGASRFLIDGFPRTLDQLMDFQTQVKPCDGVLVFSVPEEVAVERLLARGATSGRPDDADEDTIRQRMGVFWAESQPVIEFLADSGANVHEVDSAEEEDAVFEAVAPFMDAMDATATDKEEGRAPVVDESKLPLPGEGLGDEEEAGGGEGQAAAGGEESAPPPPEEGEESQGPMDGGDEPPPEPEEQQQQQPEDEQQAEQEPGQEPEPGQEEQPGQEEEPGQEPEPGQEDPGQEQQGQEEEPGQEEGPGQEEEPSQEEQPGQGEEPGQGEAVLQGQVGAQDEGPPPDDARGQDPFYDATVVLVLGSPGSDEGVQCELVRDRYGWTVLSVTDLLREEIEQGTDLGQQAADCLVAGEPVPPELVSAVLRSAMLALPPVRRRFLVDAFPRQLEQLESFQSVVKPVDGAMVLSVPEEVALVRLLARGGDEDEDGIRQRAQAFWEEGRPLVDALREQDTVVAEIDASGDPDEVYAQVAEYVGMFGPPVPPPPPPLEGEEELLQRQQEKEQEQEQEEQPEEGQAGQEQEQEQGREDAEAEVEAEGLRSSQPVAEAAEAETRDGDEDGAGGADGAEGYTQEQIDAAVRIQAARRGYQDRQRVAELRRAKQEEEEERARAQAEAAEAAEAEAAGAGPGTDDQGYTQEQIDAATRIQAARRGYQDRQRVAALRRAKQQEEEERARAQAEAEAAEAEQSELQQQSAGGQAGGAAEDGEGGGYTDKEVQAAIRIQAAHRGHRDRQRVAALRADRRQFLLQQEPPRRSSEQPLAEQEQGAGAGGAEDGYTQEQVEAAVRIQAARRGYQDRQRVAALRQAKQQEEEERARAEEQQVMAQAQAEAEAEAEAEGQAPGGAGAGLEAEASTASISYDEAMERIQAAGRGFLDRKKAAEGKEEEEGEEDRAAAEEEDRAAAEEEARAAAEEEARAAAEEEARAAAEEEARRAAEEEARAAAEELEARAAEQVNTIRAMLVVCGPSGVGKGTLIGRLMGEHGDKFGFSVSHTTRGPRPGEQDGVHYHFTDRASMQRDVDAGLFLEYADVHGNMYGTSLAAVAAVGRSGRIAVLDIDVQGASKIKASRAASKARYVFVDPPSLEVLEARLRGRGTETEDKVRLRLANATAEIDRSREPGFFNARLVNDDLDAAYLAFKTTIERLIPGTFAPEDLAPPPPPPPPPPAAAAAAAPPPPLAAFGGLSGGNSAYSMGAGSPRSTVGGGNGGAGPGGVPAAALPVRQYMDATVVPVLREALRALNEVRPDDPLKFVAEYLMEARANGGRHPRAGGNGKTATGF